MRFKGSLLLLAGALLLVLTVLLLASLRTVEDPSLSTGGTGVHPSRSASPEGEPPRTAPSPPREPAGPRRTRLARARTSAPDAQIGSIAGEDAGGRHPPIVRRITAPPVPPSELEGEQDLKKRAELKRMHELATARVRVNQLQRRSYLLEQTLERAKREKTWSTSQVQEVERELQALRTSVRGAEKEVQTLTKDLEVRRDSPRPTGGRGN